MAGTEGGYPRFLQELLESCPTSQKGKHSGIHQWLFRVARYLHRYHTPEEICAILADKSANCGRDLEPHEIPDAVRNSAPFKWEPSGKSAAERREEWLKDPKVTRSRRVPEFSPDLARERAARVPIDITPEWLKVRSPLSVTCSTDDYLRAITEPGEKVQLFNVYKSQGNCWPDKIRMERWSQIHWPDGAWFLCNPVDGLKHFNPRQARDSYRSEESVTSFRYGVLECDHEPKDIWYPIWLKILVGLELPIVSITDSAGISAHALIRGNCTSKAEWDIWKRDVLRPLVQLGADDAALSAVRLTRNPNCYRGDRLQELLYLNPSADGTPIFYQ